MAIGKMGGKVITKGKQLTATTAKGKGSRKNQPATTSIGPYALVVVTKRVR